MAKNHSICEVSDCNNPRHSKQYCGKHYYKFKTYGDPLAGRNCASRGEALKWIKENSSYGGDNCIVWPFEITHYGYGTVSHQGKRRVASRVMCEAAHGRAPTKEHQAAHSCGNGHKACMNPNHLRWATRKENCADSRKHGTMVRGDRNPYAKLTAEKVIEIRKLHGSVPHSELAKKFQVSQSSISRVANGLDWGWVKGNEESVISLKRGENSPSSILTEDNVLEIVSMIGKYRQVDIAAKFNVSKSTIYDIRKGKSWVWLTNSPPQ